jgi:hypothetical protein
MRERELRRREGHEGRVLQMNSVELTPEEVGASDIPWLLIGRWWLLVPFRLYFFTTGRFIFEYLVSTNSCALNFPLNLLKVYSPACVFILS